MRINEAIIVIPTSSTAYSPAAGGTIISPGCHAFTVAPIPAGVLTNGMRFARLTSADAIPVASLPEINRDHVLTKHRTWPWDSLSRPE
jgi:NAD kinase